MNYRIALCIPRSGFESPINGDPYLVAVPETMRFFHKRSDFIQYVGQKLECPEILGEEHMRYLSNRATEVANLPKVY